MNLFTRRRTLLMLLLEKVKYLFKNGDKCTSTTGGWEASKLATSNNEGECTIGTGYITFKQASTASYSNPSRTSVVTKNKINTKGYSKLCFEWAAARSPGNISMSLALYASNTVKETDFITADSFTPSTNSTAVSTAAKQINSIDISGYQGDYYVGAYFFKKSGVSNIHYGWIFRIWLEK